MSIPPWAEPNAAYPVPPPPKKNKNGLWIAIVATIVVLGLCLIGGTVLLLMNQPGPVDKPTIQPTAQIEAFTQADAERECYSGFRTEFERRDADRDDQDVLATVQQIEILDSDSVGGNYVVNGTVHYSLNTGGVSVSDTLDLTCTATYTSDGSIVTDVENRD